MERLAAHHDRGNSPSQILHSTLESVQEQQTILVYSIAKQYGATFKGSIPLELLIIFLSITAYVGLGFNLTGKINLKSWLREREDLPPVQRLGQFIEEVLLV